MKKLFCFPALELFHCLPLWKTVLFVSSRAFLLSTPTFLLSTSVEISEATWKKATKCNKYLLTAFWHFVHKCAKLEIIVNFFGCSSYIFLETGQVVLSYYAVGLKRKYPNFFTSIFLLLGSLINFTYLWLTFKNI